MTKKLDQELADAAGVGDADSGAGGSPELEASGPSSTPAVTTGSDPLPRAPGTSNRNLGLLATLLVMVGALVALFFVGFTEAAIYATPVDELAVAGTLRPEEAAKLYGRKVRVEGDLVPGTLVKRDDPCEYRFTMHGPKHQLPVRYAQCIIPDTFRDIPTGGVQVTVEGTLSRSGDFEATMVMAKCTSKYDPEEHRMKDSLSENAPASSPLPGPDPGPGQAL